MRLKIGRGYPHLYIYKGLLREVALTTLTTILVNFVVTFGGLFGGD